VQTAVKKNPNKQNSKCSLGETSCPSAGSHFSKNVQKNRIIYKFNINQMNKKRKTKKMRTKSFEKAKKNPLWQEQQRK